MLWPGGCVWGGLRGERPRKDDVEITRGKRPCQRCGDVRYTKQATSASLERWADFIVFALISPLTSFVGHQAPSLEDQHSPRGLVALSFTLTGTVLW